MCIHGWKWNRALERKRISCETSFIFPTRKCPISEGRYVFSIMRLAEPKNEAVPIATAVGGFRDFRERCLPRRMGRGQSSICRRSAASAWNDAAVAHDARRRRPWGGFPTRLRQQFARRDSPGYGALAMATLSASDLILTPWVPPDDAVEVFLHGERGELRWFNERHEGAIFLGGSLRPEEGAFVFTAFR